MKDGDLLGSLSDPWPSKLKRLGVDLRRPVTRTSSVSEPPEALPPVTINLENLGKCQCSKDLQTMYRLCYHLLYLLQFHTIQTSQYNFIAKCQCYCTRNVLWCAVHSSHIYTNHKMTSYITTTPTLGQKVINKDL